MITDDTICAIATAAGGALGIIRISGPKTFEIVDSLFSNPSGRTLSTTKANMVVFGEIRDNEGKTVDEVIATIYRAPHSYTGEDSIELSCHGSSYIMQQIITLLTDHGCRLAEPGEYTQRAFVNGKMDLSQAEAVADLIASSNKSTHRIALNQMRGGFSEKLKGLRHKLLDLTSLLELELDFSDHEEEQFADRSEINRLAAEIQAEIKRLTDSFRIGNVLKEGLPVAIIGETNAGKSTLLNALLNEDKAIVSNIHGTTRDIIEDTLNIGDVMFRFIDTAGIRTTRDEIEKLGIERSFQAIEKAQIILLVYDLSASSPTFPNFFASIQKYLADKEVILLLNKADKSSTTTLLSELSSLKSIKISAKQHDNLSALTTELVSIAHRLCATDSDVIVTNARHYTALKQAEVSLTRAAEGLNNNLSGEFVAQDLRECLRSLADITGEITSNNTIHNIFAHFCIGK